MGTSDLLTAPSIIEYPFKRTTGPILGGFLTGLREGVLLGSKGSDGRVHVPPLEYDPVTHEPLTQLVEIGPGGTVLTWAWAAAPRPKQPLGGPFAWALIRPDGADTAMLHAVDAGGIERMSSGMRVRLRWRAEREGHISDIECWEPEDEETAAVRSSDASNPATSVEQVRSVRTPAELRYLYTAGGATSRFLRGLAEKKILGQRCPRCSKVYVPSRGSCPSDGVPTTETVELPHKGTVSSFCVVNVQFYGQAMEVPYTSALILLDGSDLPIMHLLQEVDVKDVRIGMRVEAVWVPDEEIGPTLESIRYFRPNGEPDAEVHQPGEHGWGEEDR